MILLLVKENMRQTIKLFKNYGLLYLGVMFATLIGIDFFTIVVLDGRSAYISLIMKIIKEYHVYIYEIVLMIISYIYINTRFPLIKQADPTLFYYGTKYIKMIIEDVERFMQKANLLHLFCILKW